ncbi:hypothetical protein [Thiomonas sp.]|jgi:hypothetical protein|uniref:hypothetical protein n=1 Tax=Thiomonas sp. TaxID=2047785 RepID=UPI001771B64B|nr:hypothetical protein [Thiomonas sp.]
MAEQNRNNLVPTAAPAEAIPTPKSRDFDDLMRLLSCLQRWADETDHRELIPVLSAAREIANSGWTLVHQTKLALAFCESHIRSGKAPDALRSLEVAQRYLDRWNGDRMKFQRPTVDVKAH